jgi:hypothetical protein
MRYRGGAFKQKHKAAHLSSISRPCTNMGVTQAYVATDQRKVVQGSGAAGPPPAPTTIHHHVSLPGGSPMMVAWVHARKALTN